MTLTPKEQILMEMEEELEKRLEQIRQNNPTVRPGLLYRNNIEEYATFWDRKKEYEQKREYFA